MDKTVDVFGPFFSGLRVVDISEVTKWLLEIFFQNNVIALFFILCVFVRIAMTIHKQDWGEFWYMFIFVGALTFTYQSVAVPLYLSFRYLALFFAELGGFDAILDLQAGIIDTMENARDRDAKERADEGGLGAILYTVQEYTYNGLALLSSKLLYDSGLILYSVLRIGIELIRSILTAMIIVLGALFVPTILIGYQQSLFRSVLYSAFFLLIWIVVEGITAYVGGRYFAEPLKAVLAQLNEPNVTVTNASVGRVYNVLTISVIAQAFLLFTAPFLTHFLLGRTQGVAGFMAPLGVAAMGAGAAAFRMGQAAGNVGARMGTRMGAKMGRAALRQINRIRST